MDRTSAYRLILMVGILAVSRVFALTTSTVSTPTTAGAGGNAGTQPKATTPAPTQGSPTPAATTAPPNQCIQGKCSGIGDDESCVDSITTRCPLVGSCKKTVTKNQTHSVFTLGCGPASCPTAASTTTTKPATSTAAPAPTITSTCCETALCNRVKVAQQKSAASQFSTNILYLGGFILLLSFL